jgi:hypothetical protein
MIRRDVARRLCTAREYELVEASFPENVRRLAPSRLRQKLERARKLRDKNRDLLKRQRLEVRGKRDSRRARPAQGTANTEKKAELFQEVMDRFEAELKPVASGGRANPQKRKSPAKKPPAKKSAAKKSPAKKSAAKKSTAKKSAAKKSAAKFVTAKSSAKPSQTTRRQRKDAGAKSLGRTLRARARAANQRSQNRRDNRGR